MYNNFIYRVSLPKCCRLDRSNIPRQPGTVEIPPDSVEFIFRLANTWADGMNPVNRVENEVAMMSLAAEALSSFEPRVVPAVYDWGSYDVTPLLAFAQGWILQELMRGTPLDESFGSMHLDQQSHILTQMANILLALQNFKLPESITHFGGVTFDGFGRIVSSAMSNVIGGPWSSYEAYYQHRLELALKRADANPYIRGWRYNKARWRLDTFVNVGVSHHFDTLEDKDEKVIVHADLSKFAMALCAVRHLFLLNDRPANFSLPWGAPAKTQIISCSMLLPNASQLYSIMTSHVYNILRTNFCAPLPPLAASIGVISISTRARRKS